jgi:putative transposase
MARKLRIQYPGAIYHVMNRGDHREAIFKDEQDRTRFLETLGEACEKTGWGIHAYCLMNNHFHLVVETPQPNLVAGMKWMLSTYTCRFNHRHKEVGHLFSGRYKALIVDGSGTGYLKTVCDYVHLNPVRAHLVNPEARLSHYVWSSYPHYLMPPTHRAVWLQVDRLLGEWGIPKDSEAGRRVFEARMESRRQEEALSPGASVERGWYFGGDQFRQELLDQVGRRSGGDISSGAVREAESVHAERLIGEHLARLGWSEADLKEHRKGAPEKVRLARDLRTRTTMTVGWIAERLNMGSRGYLAALLAPKEEPATEQDIGPGQNKHDNIRD